MIRRRWLPAALALSVALNLFLLAAAGAILHQLHRPALAQIEDYFAAPLTAPDRAVVISSLDAGKPGYRAALAPLITAHFALDATLRATPFDPAAFHTALASWLAAYDNYLASFETPLTKAAAGISPAGRAMLAARGDANTSRAKAQLTAP